MVGRTGARRLLLVVFALLGAGLTSSNAWACRHPYGMSPDTTVVFDRSGKTIVPLTAMEVVYVGCGVYAVRESPLKNPVRYCDLQGKTVKISVPAGALFIGLLANPTVTPGLFNSASNAYVVFQSGDKQGVCDFAGKVLLLPEYNRVKECVGEGLFLTGPYSCAEEFVVKLDGTIIGHTYLQYQKDVYMVRMFGGVRFSEGRGAVSLGPTGLWALTDLSCQPITPAKFSFIGGFKDGLSVARIPSGRRSVCVLIDRTGKIVKEFPPGFELEWPGEPSRYIFHVNTLGLRTVGLIDAKGTVLIPARYATVSLLHGKYYVGRRVYGDDTIDFFDVNGKLLQHYPHENKTAARKHPLSADDLSVHLSTVGDFLCNQEGGLVEETLYMGQDGYRTGLVDRFGNWFVKPIYSKSFSVEILGTSLPPDQHAFVVRPYQSAQAYGSQSVLKKNREEDHRYMH